MPRTKSANQSQVKSERISVLLSPVLKEKLEKIRVIQRTSMNAIIIELLEKYAKKHSEDIQKYDNTFLSEE
jgi:hypothetical protein